MFSKNKLGIRILLILIIFSLLGSLASAHGEEENNEAHHMMGYNNSFFQMGWGWLWLILTLAFILLISILGVTIWLISNNFHKRKQH
jgi:hypothetical protein